METRGLPRRRPDPAAAADRASWMRHGRRPTGRRCWSRADRVIGDLGVVDPKGGHRGDGEAALRAGRRPLRPAAPRPARRPGGPPRVQRHPVRQRAQGLDRGRRQRPGHRARPPRPGAHGPHPDAAGRHRPDLLRGQLPRPARRAGGRRRGRPVHPDGWRPAGHAVAPSGPALALSVRADGTASFEVIGASSFPRHWIYGHDGTLQAKTGLIDFDTWYRESFGEKNPWGDEESPTVVTAVETELERELSAIIIGSNPPFRRLRTGDVLVSQGDPGDELYLLFDGVLAVEQDGQTVVEVGPGAILGEMALLEGGRRTATLRAVTRCRVAVVPGGRVDRAALAEVARRRRDGG